MNPLIFQVAGEQGDGYLPGAGQWPVPVVLSSGVFACAYPPLAGSLTLTLEVGGIDRGQLVVGPAGVAPASFWPVTVPANTAVRLRASFAGAATDYPAGLAVTVQVAVAVVSRIPDTYTVRWISGSAGALLMTYDPATRLFQEVVPGVLASFQAGCSQGATFSLSLAGVELFRVAGGVVRAAEFLALGATAYAQPGLQLVLNGVPVATLTAAGVHMVDITEGTPDATLAGFQFYSGGGLTATLGRSGLTALAVVEGLA